MKKINLAGASGIILCLAAVIYGIITNGGLASISRYLHLPSLIITLGGSLFAVLGTCDSFKDFMDGLKGAVDAYKKPAFNTSELSDKLVQLSDISRKEGLLALENENVHESPFLDKALKLIVDGTEPELTKDILETELNHSFERGKNQVKFWQTLGGFAPAWGMIGTLLGLINMMNSMGNDPSAIGGSMALALITTLYGSLIANWLCMPISRKLEKKHEQDYIGMELIIEGILSIQYGENSRILREKITALLDEEKLAG